MNELRHFSLGEPITNSPHAIASSLPTIADVCGYEEGDPQVLSAVKIGYPRFVLHPYVRRLTGFFLDREGLNQRSGILIASVNAVQDLVNYVGSGVVAVEVETGLYLVHCDTGNSEQIEKIWSYLQHVGCGISSRQAEAILVKIGRWASPHKEALFRGDAQSAVTRRIVELCECDSKDVWVCASGMNAFYTGFRAVQTVQQNRGRNCWLQLGWLYLDSGCVLKTFLSDNETLEYKFDVTDTDAIVEQLSVIGDRIAGVVVECPTNPLVQICDLERVFKSVQALGGLLMVDPTVASIYNMNVLQYADVLVTSLTKYAAYEGDVMAGSLVLNASSLHYEALKSVVPKFHISPYINDLRRLAHEMQDAEVKVEQMNASAVRLAKFLQSHSAVSKVFYAADSVWNSKFARNSDHSGAMISIELVGSMSAFYDQVSAFKGPSFGTRTTILSPFMYLAHYDLVTEEAGRALLEQAGLSHELIRISVGAEPYEKIEAVFAEALEFIA